MLRPGAGPSTAHDAPRLGRVRPCLRKCWEARRLPELLPSPPAGIMTFPRCRHSHLHFSPTGGPAAGQVETQGARRGDFLHPLKCSCIPIPDRAPSLAVSTVLGKTPEELPGGALTTRARTQTPPDLEAQSRLTDPTQTEISTPDPQPGQDRRGPHLVPTCRGPRGARLRVLTRLLSRHLRKQPAGSLLQTSGELSPPTLGCNLGSTGRELRAGRAGWTRWEPAGDGTQWVAENLGFWG